MKIKVSIFIIVTVLIPFWALAQNTDDLKQQIVLDQKKLIVMENIKLSDEEAVSFWPVYDEYQERLYSVDLMRNGIFSDYATNINLLTDEKAVFIMANLFDIAESRQEILRSFSLELEEILPAKKVFRYMLIENNISIGQIYSLAKKLPLP